MVITAAVLNLLALQVPNRVLEPVEVQLKAAESLRLCVEDRYPVPMLIPEVDRHLKAAQGHSREYEIAKHTRVAIDPTGELMGVKFDGFRRSEWIKRPIADENQALKAYDLFLPEWVKKSMGLRGGTLVRVSLSFFGLGFQQVADHLL
jgi:hypothetical protein